MAKLVWEHPPEEAWGELAVAYAEAVRNMAFVVCERWAPEIQNWMRAEAPWTDRSANARQRLWSRAFKEPKSVTLVMAHGVEYGIFLELRWAGRFAIVNPALDIFALAVWQDIRKQVERNR